MFVLNGTLIIFVASFLLFMVLLDQIMLKPVGRAIAKRQEKMASDLDIAREARQKAAGLVESYESRLQQKRSEAHDLMISAVDTANKQKTEKLSNELKEGLTKLASARTAIAAERTTLIDALVAQEQGLVEEIAEKVLGEPVTVRLDASKVRKNFEET